MRTTINSDQLDITEWQGKRQRLQTLINKEIYQRHLDNLLPYKLILTANQYDMLKQTPQMGDSKEHTYYQPHQRIYVTPLNAMEIVIK